MVREVKVWLSPYSTKRITVKRGFWGRLFKPRSFATWREEKDYWRDR